MKGLNEYRMWILEPLRSLREAFKAGEVTIASIMTALHQSLEHMRLGEKLERYRDFFLERGELGDESLAREYDQVYDHVLELLERLEGLLGAEKIDAKNYIQILDAGLQGIQVGVIPAAIDQVTVGDITRSRLEAVKTLFFVRVSEDTVPQGENGASLLLDRDRVALKKMDIELAPTAKEDGCIQEFYLYLVMSEPSGRPVITYTGSISGGKSQRPSNPMGEAGKLLPGMEVLDEHSMEWSVWTGRDAKELLIKGLWRIQGQGEDDRKREEAAFMQFFQRFYTSAEHQDKVRQLIDAASYFYEERGIGRAAARTLYDRELQGSMTYLEQFASCAYVRFLRYELELMERQKYELEAVDMGNLFHQPIDRCFACVKNRGQDQWDLTEEGRRSLVEECITQVMKKYGNIAMSSPARNAYLAGRVERITDHTIWALAEWVKGGDFEPVGFEVPFPAIDNLEAIHIGLSGDEEPQLRGRIDHMDLCRDEDHVYVKITDHKLGAILFDLVAPFYGSQLRLVVYMDTAVEMEERRCPSKEVALAGIFYCHIGDPIVDKQEDVDGKDIEKQILEQLRTNGLVDNELDIIHHLDRETEKESDAVPVAIKDNYIQENRPSAVSTRRLQDLRRFINQKSGEARQNVLMGNADLKPYKQRDRTACDYCPYRAVCGFDTKIVGYGYRKLKGFKSEKIRVELGVERNEETSGSKLD